MLRLMNIVPSKISRLPSLLRFSFTSPSNTSFVQFENYLIPNVVRARLKRSRERNRITKNSVSEKSLRSNNKCSSYDNKDNTGQDDSGKQQPNDDDKHKGLLTKMKYFFSISLFSLGILYMISYSVNGPIHLEKMTWSEFINSILPTGQIRKIVVIPENEVAYIYMNIYSKDVNEIPSRSVYRIGIPSVSRFEVEVRAAEMALNIPPEQWTQIEYRRLEGISQLLTLILIGGLAIGAFRIFKRFKGLFNLTDLMSNMTKGKYTVIDPHSPEGKKQLKVKFKDIAGCKEARQEISEFVDYFKNPNKYTKLGAKLPRGALLTGPPGCGKTLIAKALAAEATTPFFTMNGSEFVEVIGGLGASRIRGLFKEARSRAPCIIYIDEIDAIGRKRSAEKGIGGGSNEEEQTLNQLLVEMDGMGSEQGIMVLGSTNRPDILDKALLRPGRFDRHINIDLPTVMERKEMFELYLKRIKLDHPYDKCSLRLAQMTPGFSGADISNVVNEAAIRAASNGKKKVSVADLEYALEKVLAGSEKRSRTMVEEEKEIVAYHEAGHALVGWLLEHTDALLKVTIIPRTSAALGFAQYCPRDKKLFSKEELFDRMCMMLGGRTAENIKFNRITTGAEDDLKKVTQSAYSQVKLYGMSNIVGPISFPTGDDFSVKPYSKKFGHIMDQEATYLVQEAYRFTDELIRSNMDKLEIVAQELLKREVLNYDEVKNLIGSPPFGEKNVIEVVDSVLPKEEQT